MASLDNASRARLEVTDYDGENLSLDLANLNRTSKREKLLRMAFVIAGTMLLTAVLTQASVRAAVAADVPQPDAADLKSQVASRVAQLLPDGMRMKGIGLQFTPPPGATLQNVAPGVAQLRSRFFMVELQAQGRTMAYTATVDAERQVIVAAHNVPAGEAVTEHDVETRWVEAFGAVPGALDQFPAAGQYVASNQLRTGDPVYPSNLMRALAVHPGDMVSVLVKNGPVTVHTQLQSRSAAAVGDSATMVNPESDSLVTVSVTGPKTAELVIQ